MRILKSKSPTRAQTVLEYMLILAVVGGIVLSSIVFLTPKINRSSEGYYNSVSRVMMGEVPAPINGGWCPVEAPNTQVGAADNYTIYRTCECPAPAFGGAYCDPTASFDGNNVSCQGARCTPTGSCVPQCANKQCGPNGCGGSCGFCSFLQYCSSSTGLCTCPNLTCDTSKNLVPNSTCSDCICPQYAPWDPVQNKCVYPSGPVVCPLGTGLIYNTHWNPNDPSSLPCICPIYSYWNAQQNRCVYPSFPWYCPNNLIPNPYFDPNATAGTPNSFACICPQYTHYDPPTNSCVSNGPIVCNPALNWAPDPTGTQCWCYAGFYFDCSLNVCVHLNGAPPPVCTSACSGSNCGCSNGCSCGTCGASSTCSGASGGAGQCLLLCPTQSLYTAQCGSVTLPGANSGSTSTGQCPSGCTGTISAVCNNGAFSITTDTCHP